MNTTVQRIAIAVTGSIAMMLMIALPAEAAAPPLGGCPIGNPDELSLTQTSEGANLTALVSWQCPPGPAPEVFIRSDIYREQPGDGNFPEVFVGFQVKRGVETTPTLAGLYNRPCENANPTPYVSRWQATIRGQSASFVTRATLPCFVFGDPGGG